ncbi:hypothetical protein MMC13_007350 [Lambiella insularis]|nr:hypothetical protein [Lambiella insularis]
MVGRIRPGQGPRGGIEWFNPATGTWHPAVYHDDIRDVLIAQQAALGRYRHARDQGPMPNDITAYKPEHEDWGKKRAHWPPILFQYERTPVDLIRPRAGIWIHEGAVVLDIVNDPVLAYTDLPLTISSAESGIFLEAYFRLNQRITYKDVRARMPQDPRGDWDGGVDLIRPGSLSMRMTRFREMGGLLSWRQKKGSEALKRYLDSLIPQDLRDLNTTRGFRNLHRYETAELHLENIGAFAERSRGVKDLSKEKRARVRDAARKKAEKLKEEFLARMPGEKGASEESSSEPGAEREDGPDHGEETGYSTDETNDPPEEPIAAGPGSDIGEGNPEAGSLATDSELSVTDDPANFLGRPATTVSHRTILLNLLAATRLSFLNHTGQEPPPTTPTASYIQQWLELQEAFMMYRASHGIQGDTPRLVGATELDPYRERVRWNPDGPGLSPGAWVMLRSVFEELYGNNEQ